MNMRKELIAALEALAEAELWARMCRATDWEASCIKKLEGCRLGVKHYETKWNGGTVKHRPKKRTEPWTKKEPGYLPG
ncbi:MAG: hypothetical protein L5656_04545 [Thermanaeromonas sp.]|uniref:hypothetical protein n=1 Tax=Thermanaeromonas sp. TaxID=2003697 RepID=UPI00243B5B4C|nr:hypothetical protein [Thermanaeromonas sp.]MCG0277783.1 hypothetical protein [Thermanaeromonas sp.]